MSTSRFETEGSRPRFVRVSYTNGVPTHLCAVADGLDPQPGRQVVVTTQEGERVGTVTRHELPVLTQVSVRPSGTVVRVASESDIRHQHDLALMEQDAVRFFRQRSRELDLQARPVHVVAPLDRDLVVIAFAAEERIDSRELHRDLSRRLRRRVELRQVGVRDQARAAGGWGPCGRPMCCAQFMTRFNSVTIRMAKAQKLSLNPTRISGMCGRLMCCLAHEAHANEPRPGPPS